MFGLLPIVCPAALRPALAPATDGVLLVVNPTINITEFRVYFESNYAVYVV